MSFTEAGPSVPVCWEPGRLEGKMAGYGTPVGERCRFCGLDLPPDAVTVMAHISTHWRQFNLESLSPCAFEPQLDIRVGNTPLNPEDIEVSSHMEQGFQYSYSPQTEPSNLTINGARCSPLNLTGRSKSSSPLSSPLPHAPSIPPPPPPILNHQPSLGCQLVLPPSHPHHPSFSIGMLGTPQITHQIPPVHVTQTLDIDANVESHDDQNGLLKRKRRLDRFMEMRCHVCGRTFFTKSSFDEHMDSHIKDNNAYIMSDQMDGGHIVSNVMSCSMPDKPYKCAVCDREFTYKEELLEHADSHEAAKPYKCDICGAGLSHISALRRHRLAHSGYKPHRCEICSRSFFQKCDLQRHYTTHGKSKQYECGACKKKYSSLHFLENHKCKAPEEPKPFKCNICGEGCANNMAWSYHMWKHTKNPIFVPFQEKFNIHTGQTESN
ncbi:zinc finger protein 157 [Procambarus clarkii]|uniref:zinc finger protein 157 n=1 Tax=Procambarus clarkii TaxID=6728 RepID=UPI001E67904A|nr:zinc finger protein 79-like [Procambarus clarkii]